MLEERTTSGAAVKALKYRWPTEAQRRTAGVRAVRALEGGRGATRTQFTRIMAYARDLSEVDLKALPMLVAALGAVVQSRVPLWSGCSIIPRIRPAHTAPTL